jgi:hypothetical protein
MGGARFDLNQTEALTLADKLSQGDYAARFC